jgi:DNA-directed RNA polymerase specialized sigma24 family protein
MPHCEEDAMEADDSVSVWISRLQAGDQTAAQPLWERYFRRLAGLARKKLQDLPRRALDEEDVALSVFDSFCRGAEQGRFPQLNDRDCLWRLLVTLTSRKASNVRRDHGRLKRGCGAVQGESAFGSPSEEGGIGQLLANEPTPEFAAQVADECRRLLECLGDDELRQIAVWKMEGNSDAEIAARLGHVHRTVQRRLHLIRRIWKKEGAS